MKCIIFCINYNSYNELKRYLESINKAYKNNKSNIDLDVVVIDNSSKIEKIENKYFFNISHIETNSNLGYFGAFSFGLKIYSNELDLYDYIIVSNVDLEMSNNFFENLNYIKIDNNIGCIAPSIFSTEENRDRNPKILNRYTIKKMRLLSIMYKFPILYYIYFNVLYRRKKKINITTKKLIYGAHGSFMIFTNKVSCFLKKMNYPTFLFGEEIFVAENLNRLNLQTVYIPELKIYDSEHASTSKMKKRFYFKCNYNAIKTMIKEFY